MFSDREDSNNALRIAPSHLVLKLQPFPYFDIFFEFSIFQILYLLPKSLTKIPPDGAGK